MWSRIKGIFSKDKSKLVRNKLEESYRRGPIYDFKEIINTNGKVWKAEDLEKEKFKNITVPHFKINQEDSHTVFHKNSLTLLAVSYSAFSDSAVDSYLSKHPQIPQYTFRPILNPLKWMFWSKMIPSQPNSQILRGDIVGSADVFRMDNKIAGYVFLVNSRGEILWRAAGPAAESELVDLQNVIKQNQKMNK